MSQVACAAREKIAPASRYQSNPAFCDEMITSEGQIRAHWQSLMNSIAAMAPMAR